MIRLTHKLSYNRSAQYAARQLGCTSISIGGNHNASAAMRACQLQRHVRRLDPKAKAPQLGPNDISMR